MGNKPDKSLDPFLRDSTGNDKKKETKLLFDNKNNPSSKNESKILLKLDELKKETINQRETISHLEQQKKEISVEELKQSIHELKKQVRVLTKMNKVKEEKIDELEHALKDPSKKQELKINHNVSRKKIEDIVDKMLEDPNMNIKYLPDFAERQIYINIFTLLLGVVDNISDNVDINFMGHKIRLQVLEN